jgi:DNA helicase II / ATP-dependent DNA helicase PcrA
MWYEDFEAMKVDSKPEVSTLPRFSLTADIVGYQRCPRQYGFLQDRGFTPAHTVQIFYGTILHEVLDRAHHHWQGYDDPRTKGTLPNDNDIDNYFSEVESSLRARGIRAFNNELIDQARRILKTFNKIEGPHLYPLVLDTECKVSNHRANYIMEGVVDVLIGPADDPKNPPGSPSEWEIWDYKGQKRPKSGADLTRYEYQMRVYASLYRMKYGCLPKASKLYFLNELDVDGISSRPSTSILDVSITDSEIDEAMNNFDSTASQIQKSSETNTWPAPTPKEVQEIKDTCVICDFRWSCSAWKGASAFPMPFP